MAGPAPEADADTHIGRPEGPLSAHVARGMRWGLGDQVVQQVAALVVTIGLTRLLVPRDFGLFALAVVVVNLTEQISTLGLASAIIEKPHLSKHDVHSAHAGSALVGLTLALGVAASAPWVASFFDEPRLASVLVVVSITFVFRGLESVPNAILRRHLLLREFTVSSTIATLVATPAAIALAIGGAGVWALVGYAVIDSVVASLLAQVFAARAGVWGPRFTYDLRPFIGFLRFGMTVTAGQVLSWTRTNLDNVVVGKVLGGTAVGFYGLAYRVVLGPVQQSTLVMFNMVFPAFAAVRDEPGRLQRAYREASKYTAVVICPITVGIAVSAPVGVPLVLGNKWSPAITTLQILASTGPMLALSRLGTAAFQATGRAAWATALSAISLVLFAPGFVIGVHWGIEGVAWGFWVGTFVMTPINLRFVSRAVDVRVRRQLADMLPVFVATAALAAAAWATGHALEHASASARFGALVAVGAVAYVGALELVARRFLRDAIRQLLRAGRTGRPARAPSGSGLDGTG